MAILLNKCKVIEIKIKTVLVLIVNDLFLRKHIDI